MAVRLHIFDAGAALRARQSEIESALHEGIAWAEARAELDVDLLLHATDFGTDCEITAVATNARTVLLGVDIALLRAEDLDKKLLRTAIHELNHCARWPHVPHWTVAEACLLEGLALAADAEPFGTPNLRLDPETEAEALLDDLAPRALRPMEEERDWLYAPDRPGSDLRIYTVGHQVIARALAALELDPWQATSLPAGRLLSGAQVTVA